MVQCQYRPRRRNTCCLAKLCLTYQKKVPTANAFITCIAHAKDQLHSYPFWWCSFCAAAKTISSTMIYQAQLSQQQASWKFNIALQEAKLDVFIRIHLCCLQTCNATEMSLSTLTGWINLFLTDLTWKHHLKSRTFKLPRCASNTLTLHMSNISTLQQAHSEASEDLLLPDPDTEQPL